MQAAVQAAGRGAARGPSLPKRRPGQRLKPRASWRVSRCRLQSRLSRRRRPLPGCGSHCWTTYPAPTTGWAPVGKCSVRPTSRNCLTSFGLGWSLSTLASFLARGQQALTQTAAGVQQRLEFLQQEGGLTAKEAAKTIGDGFGYTLGYTSISKLQEALQQLREAGLCAVQVRMMLKRNCRVLLTTPSTVRTVRRKLNCLRGARAFARV